MAQLLKIPEVAEILGVKKEYAYQLAREKRIPAVKIGRYVRVDPVRLEEWIKNGGCPLEKAN